MQIVVLAGSVWLPRKYLARQLRLNSIQVVLHVSRRLKTHSVHSWARVMSFWGQDWTPGIPRKEHLRAREWMD